MREEKPLISVIVPVYNVMNYLPRCVDSIRNQTYQNLEILLVDDGSTTIIRKTAALPLPETWGSHRRPVNILVLWTAMIL